MTLAERLLAVVLDEGFGRLRHGPRGWELWLRDGVVHILEAETLEDVLTQAEAHFARRGQP